MKPLTEQQIIKLAKEFFQCEEGLEIGDVVVTDDLIKDFASELLALQGEDCDSENCDRLQEALRQRDNCMGTYEKLKEDPTKVMEEFEVPKIADEPRSPDKFKGGFIKEPTKDIPDDVIEKWADEKCIKEIKRELKGSEPIRYHDEIMRKYLISPII